MLLAGSFLASVLGVAAVLWVADRLSLLAQPNERSFHAVAKPSIGGIAIVVPALAYLATVTDQPAALGFALGGGLLALLGLLDDLKELGAGLKFCVQIVGVGVLLHFMALDAPLPVVAVIGFGLLWHVNLYNFMDGIDGLAGAQAMLFLLGIQILSGGLLDWTGRLGWILTGATVGFLAFNWPPARIFMGDVGALFLGLVIGGLALELDRAGTVPIAASVILLTGFWFDASYTLCVRMLTRQRVTQGHRSHLYQRLAERLGHLHTTMTFLAYGLIWLLPLAWMSLRAPVWMMLWIGLAALPLLCAAVLFGAGLPGPTGNRTEG
jgi:Fuc2NAc and GlcNAc transferase